MRAPHSLAISLLIGGLGVGFLAGLLFSGPGPDVAPSSDPQLTAWSEDHRQAAGPSDGPRSSEPASMAAQPYGASAASIVDGLTPLPPMAGEARVTGVVRTVHGRPLSGVLVRASVEASPRLDRERSLEEEDLSEVIRRFAAEEQARRARQRDAWTDESGRFVLEALAPGGTVYTVEARLRGYEFQPLGSRSARVRGGDAIELVGSAVVTVSVDVRLPDGRQPESALVGWPSARGWETREWTPARPEMRLPPGVYTLSATAGDAEEYRAEPAMATLDENAAPSEVRLSLMERAGLLGRVKVPEGSSADMLAVYALREDGDAADDHRLLKEGARFWAPAEAAYAFAALDLEPGSYLLGAGPVGSILGRTRATVLAGKVTPIDIVLTEKQRGISVWVNDPHGALVADASIQADCEPRARAVLMPAAVRCPNGSFIVPQAPLGAALVLDIRSPRYGTKRVRIPAPAPPELHVTLEAAAGLEVTVNDAPAAPDAPPIRLMLSALEDAEGKTPRALGNVSQPGAQGRRSFAPLQAGRYRITATVTLDSGFPLVLETLDVTVRPGENRVSLTLPTLSPLTILAGPERAGSRATLSSLESAPSSPRRLMTSAIVDAAGSAHFGWIPRGRYRLSLSREGEPMETMPVSVTAPGSISFQADGR